MNKQKIFLVEDHSLVLEGIKAMLENDERFVITGSFTTAEEALESAENDMPDIVLMDISLPGMSGMEAAKLLKEKNNAPRILIQSMYTDAEYIQQCLDAEVDGYIVKGSSHTDFVKAFDALHQGKNFFSEQIYDKVMESYTAKKEAVKTKKEFNITNREKEVLKLISEGITNMEISEQLFISERTVEAHRSNIMKKLSAKNTAELISKAFRHGLIQ